MSTPRFPIYPLRPRAVLLFVLLLSVRSTTSTAAEKHGSLLLVGGGLRNDNQDIYRRFIALSGGPKKAVIGIVSTASLEPGSLVAENLVRYGVPREQILTIDITAQNAPVQVRNPAVLAAIGRCTGLFFGGGDQRRAARALLGEDARGTPALVAMKKVYERGGVVAGSSAGASVQGERMISSSGCPIDTLDYGLASRSHDRGVLLSRGLGLFQSGLVDQHFDNSQCRLARLARALIETGIPRGFGVDEDTAMHVRPDDQVEVVGAGGVTVIDPSGAALDDGVLGVRISGIHICYLEKGDTYDLRTGACHAHPSKSQIPRGRASYPSNTVVMDLSTTGAVNRALRQGLDDHAATVQTGLLLRFNGAFGHGYALTFSEIEGSKLYSCYENNHRSYAAHLIRVDLRPVTVDLESSTPAPPVDLDGIPQRKDILTVVFRGLLLANRDHRFYPEQPLSRAEFASAVAQLIDSEDDQGPGLDLTDVDGTTSAAAEIDLVVSAGLMDHVDGAFRPQSYVTRVEVEAALDRAQKRSEPLAAIDLVQTQPAADPTVPGVWKYVPTRPLPVGPHEPATRAEIAVALCRFLYSPSVRP